MPEYTIWCHMKRRCSGKSKVKGDASYIKRGITVCERWKSSFENFYKDMGPRPGSEYSLDRINNDGNYEPENCRWATMKEQANNTSRNILISHNGETKTITQWADYLNADPGALRSRIINYGFSIEEALSRPFRKKGENMPLEFLIEGNFLTIEQCVKKFDVPIENIRSRYHKGWDVERIFNTPVKKQEYTCMKNLSFNNETLTFEEWEKRTGIQQKEIRRRIKRGWPTEKALTQQQRSRKSS